MTLSYAVIGTGAIGGYYGGRLAQAGCDVHFLLRSDYEQVQENGLVVDSVKGDFALPNVQAYRRASEMPPVDIALVCLKTTQNEQIADLLPPIKPEGAILLLQNGLNVESAVARHLQARHLQVRHLQARHLQERQKQVPTIFGGLCFICSSKIGPGHISHTDYGRLLLGMHDSQSKVKDPSALLKEIAVDFEKANIPTKLTSDLPMARWLKLVWNVPYNGLSVVLDATTEEMMKDDEIRQLIKDLMREVVGVADAWGAKNSVGAERKLGENAIAQMFDQTENMPSYLTSMKLDFDNRRPLEIEAILGAPLRVAESMQVAMPATRMLYQQLVFLDRRNRG